MRLCWAYREGMGLFRSDRKAFGLTEEVHRKTGEYSEEEHSGKRSGAMGCVEMGKNTRGEGGCLVCTWR